MKRSIRVVAALFAVLLSGCGSSDNNGSGAVMDIPADLSEYQQAILDDFVVTDAEYLRAVEDEADCVAQKGYIVTELHLGPEGYWLYGFGTDTAPNTEETEAERRDRYAAHDACREEYSRFITRYFQAQRVPEGAALEQAFQVLIDCLDSYGITGVTSSFTENEVVAAIWDATGDDMDLDIEVMTTCFFPNRFIFPEPR